MCSHAMELVLPVLVAVCCLLLPSTAQYEAYEQLVHYSDDYPLPNLPFAYDELEPYLDTPTLRVHHLGHHRAYTNKMNGALQQWREEDPESKLAHSSILKILRDLSSVPERWRTALRNNAGGYVNHIFYWNSMCSTHDHVNLEPSGKLMDDIVRNFGSYESFKAEFVSQGAGLFGSGYVWLVEGKEGELQITTTQNQDCPLSFDLYPLLVMDVWEHAYYLKHQNKRSEYIADWWKVVCWEQVESLRHFWHHQAKGRGQEHSEL